ncbi:putative amidohydrolase family protein [Ilyonectria robusta]
MANIDKRTGTDAKVSVEIDPSAPGTIVRIILAAESVLNVFMAIPMIFDAKEALGRMYLSDGKSVAPHAASIFQLFGISLAAMTVPMVLAIPNKTEEAGPAGITKEVRVNGGKSLHALQTAIWW